MTDGTLSQEPGFADERERGGIGGDRVLTLDGLGPIYLSGEEEDGVVGEGGGEKRMSRAVDERSDLTSTCMCYSVNVCSQLSSVVFWCQVRRRCQTVGQILMISTVA